jgi:quercetin dioxygenase-like cupin family protein
MTQVSQAYLLQAGETRLENAMLPFKVLAADSGGAISICEFVLPAWSAGPVLHRHDGVDEGFYVVSGRLEFQLDDARQPAVAGDFAWVPRGTAHTFACAGDDPVRVVAFACPGGIEHLFTEQHEYLSSTDRPPDPKVLNEIGERHGAPTMGPPITASNSPGPPLQT